LFRRTQVMFVAETLASPGRAIDLIAEAGRVFLPRLPQFLSEPKQSYV
jgi:hypothetical protein